jgi:serine/threonine-protein kinase RsbW
MASRTESPTPACWQREFDAHPVIVGEIRAGVTAFARAHGAQKSVVGDMAIAVSEAVTNAVVHAFVDGQPGRVSVIVESGEDCLLVRVIDDGRGMVPRPDSPGLGIGLSTMAMLASSCEIRGRDPTRGRKCG